MKKQLLFVDDDAPALDALRRMLRSQRSVWEMTCVDRAETAWERLLDATYDAVVTDIKMPGMSGLELLERIRQAESTRDTPVVVLTGLLDRHLKQRALELGASDLFNKPVDPGQLIARLQSVLSWKAQQDELKSLVENLRQELHEQSVRLIRSRLEVICRLGNVAEYRDVETSNHVIRVGCSSRAVAADLGYDRDYLDTLLLAAPLHDIGKLGIPDHILFKPGPLSPGERVVIERHCIIGERILKQQSKVLLPLLELQPGAVRGATPGSRVLEMAASIALTHHEKWDGTGYPLELSGGDIPLESRIVAICDVFDALTSHRPYKGAYSEEEALKIICGGECTHFDPRVCAAFLNVLPRVRLMREKFPDGIDVFAHWEGDLP